MTDRRYGQEQAPMVRRPERPSRPPDAPPPASGGGQARVETPDITVKVSHELLDELMDGWSMPVQIQIVRLSSGEHDMICKRADIITLMQWSLQKGIT